MSDTASNLFEDFVAKKYEDVDLSELGGRYVGEKLTVCVNPPAYLDALAKYKVPTRDTGEFRSSDFERWVVGTFYQNRDTGKPIFTQDQIKQMPDKMLYYLAGKAEEKYNAYESTIKNSSSN
jgi:hypothetical protein